MAASAPVDAVPTPEDGDGAQHPLWDVPVRVIHWAIALCIPLSWWTAKEGYLEQHAWLGYSVIVLVVSRLIWGVFGSPQARFRDFVRGPSAVLAYLRSGERKTPGHSPLGAMSALALWAFLLLQAGSGLFNADDILFNGPLYYAVDSSVADQLGEWHEINFKLLLGLIALHLAAIAYYQFSRRENLLMPMLRGVAPGRYGTGPAVAWWWLLPVLAAVAALLWWLLGLAPEPTLYW